MVGLEKSPNNGAPFPGIDGFLDDGKGLSLKSTENLGGIFSDGVEGFISNKEGFPLSKNELKNAWQETLTNNQINTDIISTLYIKGSDGWLKWTKASGWINNF